MASRNGSAILNGRQIAELAAAYRDHKTSVATA